LQPEAVHRALSPLCEEQLWTAPEQRAETAGIKKVKTTKKVKASEIFLGDLIFRYC